MKKNGFTLVELLGVIVILAILVVIAMPAVTNIITNSSKNTLKNEVLQFTKDVDRAFTEKTGKKIKTSTNNSDGVVANDTSVYNVSLSDTSGMKNYKYICMTLQDLVNEQYTKKNLGQDYQGYIQEWVPDGSGETITFVNITNSKFFLQGRLSVISDADFVPTQQYSPSLGIPTSQCPSSAAIPAEIVHNLQEGELTKPTNVEHF